MQAVKLIPILFFVVCVIEICFLGNVGSDNFEPGYFLLDRHRSTTFEDLKSGLKYLKRKVDGENESQLSFIKSNVSSIVDQLDTLKSIKRRYDVDNTQYGKDPTIKVRTCSSLNIVKAESILYTFLLF